MTTKEQVLTILLRHHGEWQSGTSLPNQLAVVVRAFGRQSML